MMGPALLVQATGDMSLRSVNPTDGSLIREYAETTPDEVAAALAAAARAFESWRRTTFAERAAVLRRAGALLRERATRSPGSWPSRWASPSPRAAAEADKCAWVCEHYAEHAERLPRARGGARPTPRRATWPSSRSAPCSPSCRGTSPSGRSSASPRPRSWPATWACSSTPRTSPAARSRSRRSSTRPACRATPSARCSSARRGSAPLVGGARGRRGHPHRQHAGRAGGGREGRRLPQEDRARAGRQRPLRRPRGRRPRRGGRDLRRRAPASTAGRAASRPSASSWSSPCRSRPSRSCSSSGCAPGGWATRSRRAPTSARRPGATCATSCTDRSRRASPGARGRSSAAGCPTGPGPSTRRASSPASRPGMPAFDEELFGPVAAIVAAKDEQRRDPPRQPDRLRPRRRRLHARPRARRADRPPRAAGRLLLRQRLREVRSPPAVRRDQGVRLRPGAGGVRDPGVREREDGVRGVRSPGLVAGGCDRRSSTVTDSVCGVWGNMSTGWTRTTR